MIHELGTVSASADKSGNDTNPVREKKRNSEKNKGYA
jgi:hypothetical protein